MRILFLSDVFFPRVNGVSTSIAAFRAELRRRGHEVALVAPRYGGEADGDGVSRVAGRRVPFDPEDRLVAARALRRAAERVLAERPVDLVHVHTPFAAHRAGARLARARGLPLVVTYHTFFEQYLHHYVPLVPHAVLRRLARAVTRRQCAQADRVVVPSSAMREVLAGYGVAAERLEVLPTGLDLASLAGGDGGAFRARHGIPPERPVLVHIGRMAHEKNVGFLLAVLAEVRRELPETLLVLAGEGPARGVLAEQAHRRALEDHVLFVGNLAREGELLDCFRAGDAFIFASRTETQGLVLLEAMALGVPVVSTAVLGTRDVLAARQGAVVVAEDERQFAAAVVALLRDPERGRRLGAEGRRHVAESWTIEATTERLLTLYGGLLRADRAA